MLIDRPQVVEGSSVINLTVATGTVDPSSPSVGELFFRTDLLALRTYSGSSWAEAGAANLNVHLADFGMHLTSGQNALLDALTASASELNFSVGVTSSIQTQINTRTTAHNTHVADLTVHLTSAQNSLLDSLTASAVELNYSVGVTGAIQTQLNNIYATNNTQDSRLLTLETVTVPAVQTNLNNHAADATLHLTGPQNTLLDTTISNGITAADIARLASAASLSSSIKTLLDGLEANKLALNGTQAMQANLSLGGNRITNLAMPVSASDAATKDYVDSFVQGLHWVGSTRVATVGNIALTGLQTIDGIPLAISDRVLVKNQSVPAQNGIYLVASGAWSRSNDFNIVLEINNSAVFVLEGATQNKSTWVQTATVAVLDTSPITFSAFSGPVVNVAGFGISLGVNGLVSVIDGAGITADGNNAVIVDVHAAGGLMLTTNNTSAAALTTTNAQLALTNTGVTAGTYQSATQITPFTVDLKGRLTSVGTTVTITPAFSSITGLPTTVAGYGITNAVLKTGDTMTGSLNVGGTSISSGTPTALSSWFATGAYGVSQGDNRTHFGYNTGSSYVNFIRGVSTTIDGSLIVSGSLSAGNATSTVVGGNFVLRDPSGFIFANYINSTDNSVASGVTGVMIKQGDSFIRTGTAGAIAAFISGQNFNTTGNAATATVANSANSVLWTNVSGRPTNVSAFANDANYITSGAVGTGYVAKTGDTMTGALGLAGPGASSDPYGRMAVTMAADGNNYGYIGMTRAGQVGWSMGVDSSNRVFFGTGGAGTAVNVPTRVLSIGTDGALASAAGISAATTLSAANGAFAVNGSGTVTTIGGVSPPNGAIRLTPNLHLNPGAGSAVICSWDNGNGGNAANLAFRVGNGSGGDVFTVAYNGTTIASGPIAASNITSASGVASRIVQADGSGYVYNNFFNSTDNAQGSGVTAVMVKAGDNFFRSGTAGAIASFISGQNFNTAGNAATATTASNSNALGGVAASGYLRNANNTWLTSAEGLNRLYFETSSRTYYSSNNGHEFRNNAGTTLFVIENSGSGSIAGTLTGAFTGNLNGTAVNATLAAKASTLAQNGGNGAAMTFNWAGQGGQPAWLWGGNDGTNHFVYNPSNFSVNYANTAGNSATTSQTTFSSMVGLSTANTGVGVSSSGMQPTASPGSTGATISFHRPGFYGLNMGLDSDNVFRIGGWSAAANRLTLNMNGDFTVAGAITAPGILTAGAIYASSGEVYSPAGMRIQGTSPTFSFQDTDNMTASIHVNSNLFYVLRNPTANTTGWDGGPNGRHPMTLNLASGDVTFSGDVLAYSDVRLKKNIEVIQDPLEKIGTLRGVTFDHIEQGRGTGLIAQELQAVLPEAVHQSADSEYLTVAYGNLAGLFVEAIKALNKEVAELRAEVKALKDAQ